MTPQTEPLTGPQEPSPANLAPEKVYEYKTIIIYDDKLNETIISIQPPQVSPARMLHLLLSDRLIVRNIDKIRGWGTEQLGEMTLKKIIT